MSCLGNFLYFAFSVKSEEVERKNVTMGLDPLAKWCAVFQSWAPDVFSKQAACLHREAFLQINHKVTDSGIAFE